MSSLLVIKGPNIGVRYDLGERTRIGRLGENEIQVADPNVSRVHAEIVKDRQSFMLHDRGSKNGVLINGEEVADRALQPNDEIQIGHTVFLFDSALQIRNARYSNNSVYLYSTAAETVSSAVEQSGLDRLDAGERESVNYLLQFADLFATGPAPMAEAADRLVGQIATLLHADAAILLLSDHPAGELRPVVALPMGEPVSLSHALVEKVADSQKPMLLSEYAHVPYMQDSELEPVAPRAARQSNTGSDATGARTVSSDIAEELTKTPPPVEQPLCTMCAPIVQNDEVTGALVVQKRAMDFYGVRDLGLLHAVAKIATGTLEAARLAEREATRVSSTIAEQPLDSGSIASTRSLRVQEILNAARRTAESDVTVLITGESGTGKELLARHIHGNSSRAKGPFVAIHCGSVPSNLFESELFGYEKGAFTGAARTTPGRIEAAQGGTLFFDEIGDLDLALQPKVLRFIQDRAFYRVGGTRAIDANVRIIAATNQDLAAAVRAGHFREDLWYRLNVVPFHLPPLRERREDIGQLVDYLVAKYSAKLNRRVLGANDGALALLQKYDWPGNIRELENAVERAVLLADGKILTTGDFAHIEEARRRSQEQADLERKRETKPLTEVERQHIIVALKKFNYNQARAADALGLHRNTLRNKIIEYGIEIPK